ncbi:MAG TPA: ABC transporter permease [Gammaproteobacteria bacterium]|nr:ABC transporter permease [Gammaproteobacteria bacterium]
MNKNFIALQTILVKEITRFTRIWTQTLLPPAITMALYFIIFGKLIGSQIHEINGYTYMQYIVPGLTMMAIMTNAYANTSSSFFGAKFSKSVEEMLVSSMPNYIILLGYMIGGALRGMLVGVIVLFISIFFTHLHLSNLYIILAMAFLSSMLFSLGGLINAIFAKKFDDVSFIPTFVLTPLTYLGGVFYSIEQLPDFWRKISVFNPILNIVDTFRYGMLGITDINVYFGFALTCFLFVVMFVWCLILLRRGTGLRN